MSKYVGEAISRVLQGEAQAKEALDAAATKSTEALG
jgi:hypothetical protein